MANLADLLVKLGINTGDFDKGLKKAEGAGAKFGKNLAKALRVAAFAGAAAAAGALAFSIKQYIEAEKVSARLAATLKTLNGANSETFAQFKKTGSELQKFSTYGDEEIVDAMTSMTQITQDYNSTLEYSGVLVDFAAAKNLSLESSAMLLGRALTGDITMLKRYGIVLEKGATGTEALATIQRMFAGAAAAQLNTIAGRWKAIQNTIGDIGEQVGDILAPAFRGALKRIHTALLDFEKSGALNVFKNWLSEFLYYDIPLYKAVFQNLFTFIKGGGSKTISQIETEVLAQYRIKLAEIVAESKIKGYEAGKNLGEGIADGAKEFDKAVKEAEAQILSVSETMAGISNQLVETLIDTEATINEKLGSVLKMGLNAVLDVISTQIKAYAALEATKAIATGGLTAATIAGVGVQLAIVEGLRAAVGAISLAQGGVVSGPMLATVGDTGRRSDPEIVAPLSKLEPMISRAVNNSTSNNMTFVINSNGLDNARDIVRTQIAPELDIYFKSRGAAFYGTV